MGNSIKEVKYLTDKYLAGTSLRLRKVVKKAEIQYKLTQKKAEIPLRKGVKKITTIYLANTEYEKFLELAGHTIEKTRKVIEVNSIRIAIDEMLYKKEKIYIAEVEFETEIEMNAYLLPINYLKEVTNDPEYSGFELAMKYSKNH